jgi:hypothetical protein
MNHTHHPLALLAAGYSPTVFKSPGQPSLPLMQRATRETHLDIDRLTAFAMADDENPTAPPTWQVWIKPEELPRPAARANPAPVLPRPAAPAKPAAEIHAPYAPRDESALAEAARAVVDAWEDGNLAEAVNRLADALDEMDDAPPASAAAPDLLAALQTVPSLPDDWHPHNPDAAEAFADAFLQWLDVARAAIAKATTPTPTPTPTIQ